LARDVLAYSAPLIPAVLLTAVAANADRYLIKHFVSLADTGIFGLATKLSGALNLLITSTFMLTFTARRFEIAKQPDAAGVLARIYDFYLVAFLVPATLLAIFVKEVLLAMTTPAYYQAGRFVPIILLQLLALGIHYHVEFGIFYTRKTRYYLYANIIAKLSHVILSFLLIGAFGVWGAAFAGLLSSSLHSLVLHFMARRLFYIQFDFARTARALILAAIAVGLAALAPGSNLVAGIMFKAFVSVVFVLSITWLYKIRGLDVLQFAARARASTAA
jgi:O-antigen/teichoic acid export membrane protein